MLWLFMYIETQNFNYSWKKGLVRQILKETENHDSQDTHVRFFFLNEKEVRSKQVIINQNW